MITHNSSLGRFESFELHGDVNMKSKGVIINNNKKTDKWNGLRHKLGTRWKPSKLEKITSKFEKYHVSSEQLKQSEWNKHSKTKNYICKRLRAQKGHSRVPQGVYSISLFFLSKHKVDENVGINKPAFNSLLSIFISIFLPAFWISYINESLSWGRDKRHNIWMQHQDNCRSSGGNLL